MLDVTEQVVDLLPLRVRRRVKWGECDPAGVVYTARFSDYVISAFELFMRHLMDEPGCDTPAKGLSFEFRASLRPGDEFEMTVLIADIRNRTFDLDILGRDLDGKDLFRARLTPITINRGDRSRAIELPAMLRERLESYRTSCKVIPA